MADRLITSANATATLTVETLFSAPINLENWASDKAWEPEDWKIGDSKMSVDGHLNMGYIAEAAELKLTFSPNSKSLLVFDSIFGASTQGKTVYRLGLTFRHKDLGRGYTYVNGHLVSGTPAPPGGEMLEERSMNLRFERVEPFGI